MVDRARVDRFTGFFKQFAYRFGNGYPPFVPRKTDAGMPESANDLLTVTQSGRTLVSLGLGWIGGFMIVQAMEA
ncbi:hypothetical protein [Thermoactinomyces mirandus]|uniref:Uncharacterized protein n=1 Tax=Thermoactinomyces mirandus TaxID=2756294 RepID=A0A7W1XS53_9BACL|nr:hypothetical protein [Thermoactinomyces mirandus]MBA4602278.1 hypothetical protein [Thermoactinomyces mirandus]